MERKPWSTKLANLFGVGSRIKKESFQIPLSEPATRPVAPLRRSKRHGFPSKSMRRGVQQAVERKQRPSRLNWIAESCAQARALRRAFRQQQLVKREIRAELRKAA